MFFGVLVLCFFYRFFSMEREVKRVMLEVFQFGKEVSQVFVSVVFSIPHCSAHALEGSDVRLFFSEKVMDRLVFSPCKHVFPLVKALQTPQFLGKRQHAMARRG